MNRSDEHATHGPRRRWWQDLRWITAGIVVVLLALILWGLFGPEPPITVSRETTVLTEPLAADGLPDYGAAVVASLGPAPKPEDNAAVELLQVSRLCSSSEVRLTSTFPMLLMVTRPLTL